METSRNNGRVQTMNEKKLVLGAGRGERQVGAVHHDMIPFPGIDVGHDLSVFPWPFQENEFHYVTATHLVEHLPSLIDFMNSAWRIIERGGILEIETPNAGVNPDLEFGDPTHVRCYRPCTFINYFTHKGRHFGYTERLWEIVKIRTFALEISGDTIQVALTPLK